MDEMRFQVSFFKTLMDSSGHLHECCQGEIAVQAVDEVTAVSAARKHFALSKHIPDWSLYADYAIARSCRNEKMASSPVLP
jgi:hypothetical protein